MMAGEKRGEDLSGEEQKPVAVFQSAGLPISLHYRIMRIDGHSI